jgi:hypothetical protein
MLPSIAVERPIPIRQSWQLSKGNGWRLALLTVFLPWLGPLTECSLATPLSGEAAAVVSITLYAVFVPLEIALLWVSCRHLIE